MTHVMFWLHSNLLLSLGRPSLGESLADTTVYEISMWMTHSQVWCQSSSQMPNPLSPNLFKKLFCPSGGRSSRLFEQEGRFSQQHSGLLKKLVFPQGEGTRFSIYLINDLVNIQFSIFGCTHLIFSLVYLVCVCVCERVRGKTCIKPHKDG